MQETERTPEEPYRSTSINARSRSHRLITGAIGLLIVIAACAATYFWQHNKLDSEISKYNSANTNLAAADKQLSSMKGQLSSIQAKYNQAALQLKNLQQPSTPPTQSDLNLVVNKAVRYTWAINEVNQQVAVDISLTNPTKSAIFISTNNFELQDRSYNTYSSNTLGSLPSGYVAMNSQTIQPGQTIRGTLSFTVANTALSSFTLLNGKNSYQVSVQ